MKRQFFLVMIVVAGFFPACNVDNSGGEEAIIESDSSPRYSISITTEKEEAGGVVAVSNSGGIVTISPAGRIKAGATVTLSARPQLIADDAEVEGDVEYWFVKSIRGAYSMEGGPERTNVSFRPSTSVPNEWTFRMTPGDLTIDVEFTQDPDETTARLGAFYVSAGAVSPNFTKDKYDYTVAVPPGTTEFSISAQAENPYLEPVLLPAGYSGGDSLLDADLMAPENGGPLPEGSNKYQITVTSGDGSEEKTYSINVICLPNLSLKTFQVTKDDFVRDLAPSDTQSVYLPYSVGINVVAEAADPDADVTVPASIPTLPVGRNPLTVTVTVSKYVNGVDAAYSKDYVLNLYYGEGMDPDPLAEGGYVSFIPSGTEGFYYEAHTFRVSDGTQPGGYSEHALTFTGENRPDNVEVLVVAGGGGGGKSDGGWRAGGGGAGGYVYVSSYPVSADSIPVKIGAGGAKATEVATNKVGGNGGDSAFDGITAKGGGGGASHGGYKPGAGAAGGSGGGGSQVGAGGAAAPGTVPGGVTAVTLGNKGGGPTVSGSGCGGGGAGGPGGSPGSVTYAGALGGLGVKSAISGGERWYAGGGAGGAEVKPDWTATNYPGYPDAYGAVGGADGDPGTGDGGSGGGGDGFPKDGGNGGSGIVIVRFLREYKSEEPVDPEEQVEPVDPVEPESTE